MHHEWQAPIAIADKYSHPLEHIVSNLMPLFLGIFDRKSIYLNLIL
jgi:methylsterol monooxygenase